MYYTDEDRNRAAARRKINQQFNQLLRSPEDYSDIMGMTVPRVSRKPTLEEYGLSVGIEDRLNHMDAEYVRSKKANRKIMAALASAGLVGIFLYFMNQANESIHPEYYVDGRLTNTFAAWGGGISSIGGFIGMIFLWTWAFDVKPRQTVEHRQLSKYKEQLSYFEYWLRKKDKNHWNNMTGHAFEQAVAGIFRNIGFTAEVSKRGGDGGIDIILQKAGRRIAVQCKRYKSAVGPHVIRDLWGTMHYLGFDEGCIVTTTGFTKGVEDFAKDKQIYLIDLNDILKANGEGGDAYLMKKIGERVF